MASARGQDTTPITFRSPESGLQMRSEDTCFITTLSTDVIYYILDFTPYESQFNFASTCKKIADCCSNILKRHQQAYKRYRVTSDIAPTTIPILLRSTFGRSDPLIAWHVRSIEIWCDRKSWADWRPYEFDQIWHEEDETTLSEPWKWQDDEIDKFLEGLEDQFSAMVDIGDMEIHSDARANFMNGFDGILKALLIAYCPRLREVKFVTTEYESCSTLGWVRRIIQGSKLHGSHWPPGLCSIESVAVGVESGIEVSDIRPGDEDDIPNTSMEVFSTLLRLPRMTSIYYKDLQRQEDDDIEFSELMPPRSSAVKHIFLDNCGDMSYSFRCYITEAPRALETFTLRAGTHNYSRLEDADQLVSGLSNDQANSLHTIMFYGPYSWNTIHGYRCSVYRNEELKMAKNLKTVAMHISDVELDCFYETADDQNETTTEEESRACFVKWFREHAFPPLVERLLFWGLPDEAYMNNSKGKFLDWLEDALISVIQAQSSVDEGHEPSKEEADKFSVEEVSKPSLEELHQASTEQVNEASMEVDDLPMDETNEFSMEKLDDDHDQHDEPLGETDSSGDNESSTTASESDVGDLGWGENLKAIYLEEIERQYKMQKDMVFTTEQQIGVEQRPSKIYFQRLVEVAKEAGIDVYTLTNRAPAKHTHEFPKAPDKFDLRSGPWFELREEIDNWNFDVYTGRMVPPGCRKCGKCERCLRVYGEEVWRSIEN